MSASNVEARHASHTNAGFYERWRRRVMLARVAFHLSHIVGVTLCRLQGWMLSWMRSISQHPFLPPPPQCSQSASRQTTGLAVLLLDNRSERCRNVSKPSRLTVKQLYGKLFNLSNLWALFPTGRGDECVHAHCWMCRERISMSLKMDLAKCNAKTHCLTAQRKAGRTHALLSHLISQNRCPAEFSF